MIIIVFLYNFCSILHCKFVHLCIYDLFQIPLSPYTHGSMECLYIYIYKYVRHAHTVTSSVFPEFEVLFQGVKAVEIGRGYDIITLFISFW